MTTDTDMKIQFSLKPEEADSLICDVQRTIAKLEANEMVVKAYPEALMAFRKLLDGIYQAKRKPMTSDEKLQAIFEAGIPFKIEVFDKHSVDVSVDWQGYGNWGEYKACLSITEAVDWLCQWGEIAK